jgi:protein ImuA
MLALRAATIRPIIWIRQDFAEIEMGQLYAPGLVELGFNPDNIFLVRAKDVRGVLRAGDEALRCAAVGAVLLEPWGEAKGFDLTASRKLSLTAAASGATAFVVRIGAEPVPSAATTRWAVRSVLSAQIEMEAPAHPAFAISLLRHRSGVSGHAWHVEWNRDQRCFQEYPALSRAVVPIPADRQFTPATEGEKRAAG